MRRDGRNFVTLFSIELVWTSCREMVDVIVMMFRTDDVERDVAGLSKRYSLWPGEIYVDEMLRGSQHCIYDGQDRFVLEEMRRDCKMIRTLVSTDFSGRDAPRCST